MLTVATDSMLSCFECERVHTSIWKATVRSEPPVLLLLVLVEAPDPNFSERPSPEIMNPDGRIGMLVESSPFMADLIAGKSMGA